MYSHDQTSQVVQILKRETWPELESQLREVSLLGDPVQKPYQKAKIELKTISTDDVWPVARYILSEHLEIQRFLHSVFMAEHGIDTLDLENDQIRVLFHLDGEPAEWALIPPIVEESALDGKPLLVDGEHRFFLARELGVPIKVIWISQVPEMYPIVATPIEWSDVELQDEVPDISLKRKYRYPSLKDFPDIASFSDVKITEDNYLYYFFRDLTPVCTSGVRRVGSK